jgi:streptogramin lyase
MGDAVVAWRSHPNAASFLRVHAAAYDAAGPMLNDLSIPSSGTVGQSVTFSVSPLDVWSALGTTKWSFGDGSSATGTSVTHGYAAAGRYTVMVESEDALGNRTTNTATITIRPAYEMAIELGTLAGPPTDVATNSEGDVWVSSWEMGTVREFNEKGEPLRAIGALESPCSGSLEGPYGLAVDSAGDLWVTDMLDGFVRKFSPEGKCLLQVGLGGRTRGIALDAHGNVWVSGTAAGCLQELSGEGVSERAVPCALGGTFTFPGGLAIDPHGHIWLADIANSRVIELGEAGEYLRQIGRTSRCGPVLCLPMAVATDANGHIFVASGRIDEFSESGELLVQFGGFGSGPGQMEFPMCLTADSKGNLWVADTGNGRVQKWSGG